MARVTTEVEALELVNQLWWLGTITAILAIIFGTITIFWPALTLVTLIYLISSFVIALGLVEIVRGIMSIGKRDTWWATLILGLISLGVGVYLARHPHVTFTTFVLVVGITFIVRGVTEVMLTFFDNVFMTHRVLSFIVGLLGIAVGIIILVQPVSGSLAFVWVLGLYALVYGVMSLSWSIRARNDYNKYLKSI